jgi:hypothetical protein
VWKPTELSDIHSDKFDLVLVKLLWVIVEEKFFTLIFGLHGIRAFVDLVVLYGGLGGKQAIYYI